MLTSYKMAAEESDEKTGKKKSNNRPKGFWKRADHKFGTGNREKGHAFVEARKRKALKEYKKLLKRARLENSAAKECLQSGADLTTKNESAFKRKKRKVTRFTAAEREFKKTKQERVQQIKEREEERKKQAEMQRQKLKQRRQNFNRLNRRTRKGQPVMATQIEHLLQKIHK